MAHHAFSARLTSKVETTETGLGSRGAGGTVDCGGYHVTSPEFTKFTVLADNVNLKASVMPHFPLSLLGRMSAAAAMFALIVEPPLIYWGEQNDYLRRISAPFTRGSLSVFVSS